MFDRTKILEIKGLERFSPFLLYVFMFPGTNDNYKILADLTPGDTLLIKIEQKGFGFYKLLWYNIQLDG